MKLFIAALMTLVSTLAWAGPFVSEGTGPGGEIVACKGSGRASAFIIRRTAAITFIQGLYVSENQESVSMGCKRGTDGWACQQLGVPGGENVLYAKAYRNSQGIVTAQIFRHNIAGQPVLEDSLLCQAAN